MSSSLLSPPFSPPECLPLIIGDDLVFQEEDVYYDEKTGGWEWVWGRQERFHLVKPKAETEGRSLLGLAWSAMGAGWKVGRWD